MHCRLDKGNPFAALNAAGWPLCSVLGGGEAWRTRQTPRQCEDNRHPADPAAPPRLAGRHRCLPELGQPARDEPGRRAEPTAARAPRHSGRQSSCRRVNGGRGPTNHHPISPGRWVGWRGQHAVHLPSIPPVPGKFYWMTPTRLLRRSASGRQNTTVNIRHRRRQCAASRVGDTPLAKRTARQHHTADRHSQRRRGRDHPDADGHRSPAATKPQTARAGLQEKIHISGDQPFRRAVGFGGFGPMATR